MAPVTSTQVRDGIAWATEHEEKASDPSENPFVWFWEAIQGDFNDNRSTSQIATDAAISMIPGVDQICDVRDLIADCKKLAKDSTDAWAWVGLALTLIGLFPTLGSLVKGVLKILFVFVRRSGGDEIAKAVELGMSWVISFLRRPVVQRYLRVKEVDELFAWLVVQVKAVRGSISVAALTSAFDTAHEVIKALVDKVSFIPKIGGYAKSALDEVAKVRLHMDAGLGRAIEQVQHVFNEIIVVLEKRALMQRSGIHSVSNIHFRGALPEATAVTLMRTTKPRPSWLSKAGGQRWEKAVYGDEIEKVNKGVALGWPPLSKDNIKSFHKLCRIEIKGPAKLFRVISPNSRAMGDCWVSEEIFKKLQNAQDPRSAWRKYLAVWPDWNVNGQFVMYEVKSGETLKAWAGPASSQARKSLPDDYLEGGWEQIVFKVDRKDPRNDAVRYYKVREDKSHTLKNLLGQDQFERLTNAEKAQYGQLRERINHPNISGPFDTGWGCTDFNGAGFKVRVGLPALPGQTTTLR